MDELDLINKYVIINLFINNLIQIHPIVTHKLRNVYYTILFD